MDDDALCILDERRPGNADHLSAHRDVLSCLHGGVGIGDRGSCGQLCDDNCDCSNPDLVCTPWIGANAQAEKDFFQRNGYCADPLEPDGGIDPGIPCGSDAGTD